MEGMLSQVPLSITSLKVSEEKLTMKYKGMIFVS